MYNSALSIDQEVVVRRTVVSNPGSTRPIFDQVRDFCIWRWRLAKPKVAIGAPSICDHLVSTHYHRIIFSTRSASPPQAVIMRASKISRSISALRTTRPGSRAISSLKPGSIGTQSSSSSLLSSSSSSNQHGRLISSPSAGSSQSMGFRLFSTSPTRSSSGEIAIK